LSLKKEYFVVDGGQGKVVVASRLASVTKGAGHIIPGPLILFTYSPKLEAKRNSANFAFTEF
jgi:hypothetical protein